MPTTQVTHAVALMNLGIRDPTNLIGSLVQVANLTPVTITQSGALAANSFAVVLDASVITLPAAPANGTVEVVVNATPGQAVKVIPGGSDHIAGSTAGVLLTQGALPFIYSTSGTTWSV